MQLQIVPPALPATFLVVRIGRVVLLIPWILVWAIALVVMPVCWAIGFGTRASAHDPKRRLLRNWHWVVMLLVMMRGTTISVRSREKRVYLKWI